MEIEPKLKNLSNFAQKRQEREEVLLDQNEADSYIKEPLNLRPFLRTFKRKALLIVAIPIVVVIAGLLSTAKQPDKYVGSFEILVEPVTTEGRSSSPDAIARNKADDNSSHDTIDYPTQLEILQSPKILEDIIEQVKGSYPSFNYIELRKGLKIKRNQGGNNTPSKIIEVSYEDENTNLVIFVLEKTADKFLKYSLEERISSIGEGVKFIDSQTPALQKQVKELGNQLQILQMRYKLFDPKVTGEELFTQSRALAGQQEAIETDLNGQKTLYKSLQEQVKTTPDEALAISTLSEDLVYRILLQNFSEIENQIALESTRFTADNPSIQALKAKRESVKALMNKEAQRVLGKQVTGNSLNVQVNENGGSVRLDLIRQLVSTVNQIKLLETRHQDILQAKKNFDRALDNFPGIARQYLEIQRQLEINTQTLNQLLSQRATLQVEAAQNQVPWELVSPPQLVDIEAGGLGKDVRKSSKKVTLMALLGLMTGILAAFSIERYRDVFYTVEDLEDDIKLPILGEIPVDKKTTNSGVVAEVKEPEKEIQEHSLKAESKVEETDKSNDTNPLVVKAVYALYSNIRLRFSELPVRSLAVCSADDGDGKSTIALHLAQMAASVGQRVLLVDTNLSKPHLHEMLGIPNLEGLSDMLDKKQAISDFIMQLPQSDNLFVLTAGQSLSNSSKMLASSQMQDLIENFQAAFDLVIYDTSHLSASMDGYLLGANTDGVLMVAVINKTKRSALIQVMDELKKFNVPSLGLVANQVAKNYLVNSFY